MSRPSRLSRQFPLCARGGMGDVVGMCLSSIYCHRDLLVAWQTSSREEDSLDSLESLDRIDIIIYLLA